ncbi:kinase-like domain-containing protein [Pholiota molesta]|nr:kinase-like domain-containing protein [Pholiota molesta]
MPTPVVARKRKRVHQPTVRYNAVKEVGSSGRLRDLIAFGDTPPPSSTTSPSTINQPSMYASSRAATEAQALSPSSSFVTASPAPKKRKSDYREEIRKPEAGKPQNPVGSYDDKEGNYIFVPNVIIHRSYRTIRLLGQGTFAKVVEAVDTNTNTKVAIKIIKAIPKYREASKNEVRVLQKLRERDPTNKSNCVHLLSWFEYRNHICLVSELLGISVYDFMKGNDFAPFPRHHIQKMARQLCSTVTFVHDLQLIHTDLKPENILLVRNDYRTVQNTAAGKRNVRPTPKRVLECTDIRLIDFGSAAFEQDYHPSIVSTRHYRAPEIILGLGWSFPCDAYSLGCILVEFFTGITLYQTHDDLEHLAMMERVMGKIPEPFARASARSKPEFFKDSKLDWPQPKTTRKSKKDVRGTCPLQDIISPVDNINQELLDVVQKLLAFDPAQRITVREVLQHPYFALNIPIEM